MDTKVHITPSSQNKSYIHVIVDALGGFFVTVPITDTLDLLIISTVTVNLTMLKQQLGHFYITGLSNLVHPYALLLIVDQNVLTPIWHTFVPSWVLDTHIEHLTPLGLMDSLIFQTKTLVHIFVCVYKTLPRIGHTKFICTPLHITHNIFQLSMN